MRQHFREMIMNLERIEKKFRSKFRLGTPRECGSSGFILSDGSVMPILGHERACEQLGFGLTVVLRLGMCRYLIHTGRQGDIIAFEYYILTPEQKIAIRGILKAGEFYTVVTTKTTINRHRPIRSLNF